MGKNKSENLKEIKNLEECFALLDIEFNEEDKKLIKECTEKEFLSKAHHTTGMWIRNNWIRKGKLVFVEEWREKGAKHMDDVSSIILLSYHRYLKGEVIDLDGQLESYKRYWDEMQNPKSSKGSRLN